MLSSYERAFQYKVKFEYGQVWRKLDFSNINLYYKNIAKNGLNNEFLEPKMVLDLIFDGFFMYLYELFLNLKNGEHFQEK